MKHQLTMILILAIALVSCKENKDNAMKIINEYLPKIKSVMLNYFRYYYEINNKEENEEAFKIMEDKEWLYQRSLDKYLWYLQPEINKKK